MDIVPSSVSNNATEQKSIWEHLFVDLADPRTSGWFLMDNPLLLFAILFSYLYFVLKCGPNYMKDKNPYCLKRPIMIYNLFQVIMNSFLFYEAVKIWATYNWNCEPVDRSTSPLALRTAFACYLYFLNKLTDLMDTVFFVLRKKDRQISFLHLFHHAMMPASTWILVKYFPGGHGVFIGLLNTFVHILLYSYYYLAAFGPKVQKYLWWKRYITKIQLLQFGLVFIHQIQLLFFDCGYPAIFTILTLPNAVIFYYLFSQFYKENYQQSPKTNQKVKSK